MAVSGQLKFLALIFKRGWGGEKRVLWKYQEGLVDFRMFPPFTSILFKTSSARGGKQFKIHKLLLIVTLTLIYQN